MSVENLYSLLADGNFHSGEELGRALGVSRTAVWKQLKKLDQRGVEIETVRGRGYRLAAPLDLLSAERIERTLAQSGCGGRFHIDVRDEVDSTNSVVATLAAPRGSVAVSTAERQTAGRGRRGKSWVSPYASNLYFSLLWEFEGGAAALEGLSLAIGVALARVVQSLGAGDVGLKWPNDVHCHGRKLAGILLELQGDPDGRCAVIIGVGVNVRMPPAAGAVIDQGWTDLASIVPTLPDRSVLLGQMLAEVYGVVSCFERDGFEALQQEWQRLDVCAGQPVVVKSGEYSVEGVARGVTSRGALQLDCEGEVKTFSGGEVSLRRR